jgi:molybdopterin synthase catalytic subunit
MRADEMQVQLRYFAIVRETLGRAEETRAVEPGTTAGALFDQLAMDNPKLQPMKRATMLMVNQEYVPADHVLADGDEVAFIPPVSGGAGVTLFRVQAEPLDAREVEAAVADPGSGATVTFTGTVRDHARGQQVTALDYEAYAPAAEKMLAQIGDEIRERWGIDRIAVIHRVGRLEIGEASVVIAVSSAHRGEAFAACQYAIERLKAIVPIWKKEAYEGGEVWIGSEADYQRETGRPLIADAQ